MSSFEIVSSRLEECPEHEVLRLTLGGVVHFDNKPSRAWVKVEAVPETGIPVSLLVSTFTYLDIPLADVLAKEARRVLAIALNERLANRPSTKIEVVVCDPTAYLLLTGQAGPWRKMQKRWADDFRRLARKCPAPVTVRLGAPNDNAEFRKWVFSQESLRVAPTREETGEAYQDWYRERCLERGW